jgi:hypothetical protein
MKYRPGQILTNGIDFIEIIRQKLEIMGRRGEYYDYKHLQYQYIIQDYVWRVEQDYRELTTEEKARFL